MSDLSVRSSTVISDISSKDSQQTTKSGSPKKTFESTLKDTLGTDKVKTAKKSKTDTHTEPTAKRTFGFAEKFPKLAFATGLLLSCVPLLNLAVVLSPETFFGGSSPTPGTDQFRDSTQVEQGHYSDQVELSGGKQKTQALARTGGDLQVGTTPLEKRQMEQLTGTALDELRGPFKALYTSDKHLDLMCDKLFGQSLGDSFSQDDINELKKTIGEAIQDNQPALSRQQIQDFVAETLKDMQKQTSVIGQSGDTFTADELTSIFCSDDTLDEICKQVTGGIGFKDSLPPDKVATFKSQLEQAIRTMDGPLDLDKTSTLLKNRLNEALGIHKDYRR